MTFGDAGDVYGRERDRWEDRADRTADEDRAHDPRDVAGAYDVVSEARPLRFAVFDARDRGATAAAVRAEVEDALATWAGR